MEMCLKNMIQDVNLTYDSGQITVEGSCSHANCGVFIN